jgi:DtxR family Mn-dependent transcriptional regulator
MKVSSSKENYIKSIFHLQEEDGIVTTNALARQLDTRAASVTDMLKKLKTQKLIIYEKYRGFKLSPEGKKMALQIVRKHRLWELFLVKKLNFGWEEVHEMAEELEHISSKKLVDRLDEFLGFPKADPHGDPIPDTHGKVLQKKQVSLTDMKLNSAGIVSNISDQSPEMLDLLRHKGLGLGTRVEVKKRFAFDDSVELKVKNLPAITISGSVAKKVFVTHEE